MTNFLIFPLDPTDIPANIKIKIPNQLPMKTRDNLTYNCPITKILLQI